MDAWKVLAEHEAKLKALAKRMARNNPEISEELWAVCVDTIHDVCRRMNGEYIEGKSTWPYVKRSMWGAMMKWKLKSSKRLSQTEYIEDLPPVCRLHDPAREVDLAEQVDILTRDLHPIEKYILYAHVVHGMSHDEIGKQLKITKYKARKYFRHTLTRVRDAAKH